MGGVTIRLRAASWRSVSGAAAGFALAGVDVRAAEDDGAANDELDRVEGHVGLLILTPCAGHALRERLVEREDLVWVTLPG
jgi:hypothetical protein